MREAAPSLDVATVLAMVPVRNAAVRTQRHGKTLILYAPIRKRWWMGPPLSWLPGVNFRGEKGFAIDRLGEQVWEACDGQRTIEEVVDGFAARHRLRFHEARLSVMAFLRTLMQRDLVALVAADEPDDDAAATPVRDLEHA